MSSKNCPSRHHNLWPSFMLLLAMTGVLVMLLTGSPGERAPALYLNPLTGQAHVVPGALENATYGGFDHARVLKF